MSNSCIKASSVIVFGKYVFSRASSKLNNAGEKCLSPFDYKILVAKRSAKSSFMPNGIVFPGGIAEEADSSPAWLSLYRGMDLGHALETYPFVFNPSSIDKKVRGDNSLSSRSNGDWLPDNISRRITAIRELFEECGLLLAKKASYVADKEYLNSGWSSFLHSHEILKWQRRVHDNPGEFIKLCEEVQCVPDVWSLKDWIIWLTPMHLPTKRFDTTFFVAALNQIPPTAPDCKELAELKWMAPDELLGEYNSEGIWLPPPQFYELSRLANNFHQVQQLLDYSNAWYGCPRWMPVGLKAADGWIYLLPGDELYPEKPNFFDTEEYKMSKKNESEMNITDLRAKCSRLHRMEIKSLHDVNIIISQNPSSDQMYPKSSLKNSRL
ncbi:acyl-coenzyme A diphosphatase NUDT19-like [Ischnura elegans]|uniref:acyl-coenzyme A diphosphatase NUDT19-like n=1 Tax=Ischnura elegans TaxID=197161 RepID=UPI001ED8B46A|nr:acyl-coenzyme A diphosphatase NUDT19-like [Ischnura elegans]